MPDSESRNPSNGRNALVISPNAQMLAEVVPLLTHHLAGIQVTQVRSYPGREGLEERVAERKPSLCFLDVTSDPDRALGIVEELLALERKVQIVILLSENSPDRILQFLRRGASEFLTQPFNADDLKPVLERLSHLSPAVSYGKGARVICVTPAKGACGASTIASNLAHQRKRLGAKKSLLVDLDPLCGTVSFLLKLKSHYSVLDALSRATSLDEDLWKGMVSSRDGLDILLSPENAMDSMQELPDPTPVIEFARQLYDVVLIDGPTLYGQWGLALAAICDELLLVTTNELPALQATQRLLAYLDQNRVERSKVRLVVNQYSEEIGLSKNAIATALHNDLFCVLPSDCEVVHRALVDGKPIPPSSTFGRSLIALADRLGGKEPARESHSKKSLGGRLTSLFSRGKASPSGVLQLSDSPDRSLSGRRK